MGEPAYKYNEQDKVLCFHGPLIYEAKVKQRLSKNSGTKRRLGLILFVFVFFDT